MVKITVELIRKKSEHNEGEIATLEEISLHQENIEKIELIDKLCRNLKILLLQYNLIPKIENLNLLKRLEYLNLALNNIEIIENLEGLESLKKLDLTVNFIGDLRDVKKLKSNEQLEQLFLTGNPCSDYEGYREYVLATLPQLKELDMKEITRSERILALQKMAGVEGDVIRSYRNYVKTRKKQVDRHAEQKRIKIKEVKEQQDNEKESEGYDNDDDNDDDDEEEIRSFWNAPSYHTPEDRIEIAKKMEKIEKQKNSTGDGEKNKKKYIQKLFSPDGRPYNLNQAKIAFKLNDEDDRENIILEISTYRHLDTSHLTIDVQPQYVRVSIKGKILQLSLPCEVSTDKSIAKRNMVTGNLVITMPRLSPLPTITKLNNQSIGKLFKDENHSAKIKSMNSGLIITKRELLEIGPPKDDLDFSKIYKNPKELQKDSLRKREEKEEKALEDFIDDPDVPPLEQC